MRAYQWVLVSWLGIAANGLTQQVAPGPKEIVERYWDLQTKGEIFNAGGRTEASSLVLHPSSSNQHFPLIVVVGEEHSVWEPKIENDKAEVVVGFQDICRCNIDSQLRVYVARSSAAVKTSAVYKLTSVKPSGAHVGAWKINCCIDNAPVWLTVSSAIEYLMRAGEEVKDPQLKANAADSVQKLRRFSR